MPYQKCHSFRQRNKIIKVPEIQMYVEEKLFQHYQQSFLQPEPKIKR